MLDLLDAGLPAPARGVFTTRQGGVSLPPWDSLNLAVHVDDAFGRVQANRELLAKQLGVDGLAFGKQVHGNEVRLVKGLSNKTSRGLDDTDGLVTTVPGIALVTMAADCLPVLLTGAGVVGAAHVGRPGLVKGLLTEVVCLMRQQGAHDICAVIGPGICGLCYEVPASMAGEVEQAAPGSRCSTRQGTTGVDLIAGATAQLAREGVPVTTVGGCTLEQPDRFYSYRRDGSDRPARRRGLVVREDDLRANLAEVDKRIAVACTAAGRAREDVTLIAVTKTWPAADAAILRDLGVRDLAENRDQEAREKAAAVDGVRWHFVGSVQTNKARSVATYADVVHAVDRTGLVEALSSGAVRAGRVLEVLLQVSLDGDPTRGGAPEADLPALADAVAAADGLVLRGLMAVAPLGVDPATAFAPLPEISGRLQAAHPAADLISAGMSGDLEAAVARGSTHVRVGTALLGHRQARLR